MTSDSAPPPSLLLFRPGALGDAILTIDAILSLRAAFPGAHVEFIGNADGGRLLAHWGLADDATAFDSMEVTSLFRSPPEISPRWLVASLGVFWVKDCRLAGAFATAATSATVVCTSPEPAAGEHAADRLTASVARSIPAITDLEAAHSSLSMPTRWRPPAERVALLHPGSGSVRKNWPAVRYADLAARFLRDDWCVQILCGPADEPAVEQVLRGLAPPIRASAPVVRPVGIIDLEATLLRSTLFVGNDSGVAHVSGRLGVPTVALFGATDPRNWAPRGPRVLVIGRDGAWPSVDQAWTALVAARLWDAD